MWAVSEIGAMATDLAEFLGGAVGLSLLLHLPLLVGMVVVGVLTLALLRLDRGGFRPLELVIGGLVGLIGACYLAELVIVPPNWLQAAHGALVPRLPDTGAVTLAVGIFGATVMPHAIYLHSGLTQARTPARERRATAAAGALFQPRGDRCAEPGRAGECGDDHDGGARPFTPGTAMWPKSRPRITRWRRCWVGRPRSFFCFR